MTDSQRRVYELAYPLPAIAATQPGPTLVVALQGYSDAGKAVELATDYLLEGLESTDVAIFDIDELIDYRSRRPMVILSHSTNVHMTRLKLAVRLLKDKNGKPFFILAGPEPDFRWEAFTGAVADIVERFGISQTVCLYSAAMSVPHTRPMVLSAHGNAPRLVSRHYQIDGDELRLPGSASLSIEDELIRRGRDVAGYATHVPPYIVGDANPEAAVKLLNAVELAGDLRFPLRALEKKAAVFRQNVAEAFAESPEKRETLRELERVYDQEVERYRREHPDAIMPGEGGAPTGDEIGEELEHYLASLAHGEVPSAPSADHPADANAPALTSHRHPLERDDNPANDATDGEAVTSPADPEKPQADSTGNGNEEAEGAEPNQAPSSTDDEAGDRCGQPLNEEGYPSRRAAGEDDGNATPGKKKRTIIGPGEMSRSSRQPDTAPENPRPSSPEELSLAWLLRLFRRH